jgi:hypothetical protein
MMGNTLILELGRRYADRRGRTWSCVAIVAGDPGASVAVCRDEFGGAQLFGIDGRALARRGGR